MLSKTLTTLKVSTELFHVEPLQHYIGYLAEYCKVPSAKRFHLSILIEEIFTHIIKEAFNNRNDGTITIIAEVTPANFVLKFHYLGIPFGYNLETAQSIEDDISNTLIHKLSSSYKMIQHGKEGQTIEINIALPAQVGERITKIDTDENNEVILATDNVVLREIEESDLKMLVQCLYNVFGYTYSADSIYYPEIIAERKRQGLYRGLVAINEKDKVVAHVAMLKDNPNSCICECGQAFVSPEYGKRGLFHSLKQQLINEARNTGLYGVTSSAVTGHLFTQKVNLQLGCVETGLALGYIPTNLHSMIARKGEEQRQSVIYFYYSCKHDIQDIYVPNKHITIIEKNYKLLNIKRNFLTANPQIDNWDANSLIEMQMKTEWNQVHVEIKQPGKDLAQQIINISRQGIICGASVVYIDLPLNSMNTPEICAILEKIGFFYSGITPYQLDGCDSLKMQYLVDMSLDSQFVYTQSEWGGEIKDYIFKCMHEAYNSLNMPI